MENFVFTSIKILFNISVKHLQQDYLETMFVSVHHYGMGLTVLSATGLGSVYM